MISSGLFIKIPGSKMSLGSFKVVPKIISAREIWRSVFQVARIREVLEKVLRYKVQFEF